LEGDRDALPFCDATGGDAGSSSERRGVGDRLREPFAGHHLRRHIRVVRAIHIGRWFRRICVATASVDIATGLYLLERTAIGLEILDHIAADLDAVDHIVTGLDESAM